MKTAARRRPSFGIRLKLPGGSGEGVQGGDALHAHGALFPREDAASHPQPRDNILRLVLKDPSQDRPACLVIVRSDSLDSQLEGFGDRGDLLKCHLCLPSDRIPVSENLWTAS
jgi:hypothetical protein